MIFVSIILGLCLDHSNRETGTAMYKDRMGQPFFQGCAGMVGQVDYGQDLARKAGCPSLVQIRVSTARVIVQLYS